MIKFEVGDRVRVINPEFRNKGKEFTVIQIMDDVYSLGTSEAWPNLISAAKEDIELVKKNAKNKEWIMNKFTDKLLDICISIFLSCISIWLIVLTILMIKYLLT